MTPKELLIAGAALTCTLYISLFPLVIARCVQELIQGWRVTARRGPASESVLPPSGQLQSGTPENPSRD